jgi:hypothetical protein
MEKAIFLRKNGKSPGGKVFVRKEDEPMRAHHGFSLAGRAELRQGCDLKLVEHVFLSPLWRLLSSIRSVIGLLYLPGPISSSCLLDVLYFIVGMERWS